MLKTAVLPNIYIFFGNNDTFYFSGFTDSQKEVKNSIYFKIEIFCNITNAFTATFDQFNASLMNKSIHFVGFIVNKSVHLLSP